MQPEPWSRKYGHTGVSFRRTDVPVASLRREYLTRHALGVWHIRLSEHVRSDDERLAAGITQVGVLRRAVQSFTKGN